MALDRSLNQYRAGFWLVDALAIFLAFVVSYNVRHRTLFDIPEAYLYALPYTLITFLFAYRWSGAYNHRRGGVAEAIAITRGACIGMFVVLALGFFYRGFAFSRLTAILFPATAVLLTLHLRASYRAVLELVFGRSQWLKRVLLVGDSSSARLLVTELTESKSDYQPVGIVTHTHQREEIVAGNVRVPIIGNLEDFKSVLDDTRPDLVIITDPGIHSEMQRQIVEICSDRNVHWKMVPEVPTPPDQDIGLTVVAGLPLLGSKGNNITGFNYVLKRGVDAFVALTLLVLFSPLMLFVAAMIKLISRGPILFSQERIGYRGRPFKFYKFRSMEITTDDEIHREFVKSWIEGNGSERKDGDVTVHKITKDPRVIPFIGPLIRKFSIDELPQLLNVLRGEMSLVGPRPCLPYELEMYRRWHKMRFDALPGITGLWQVSGRNRLTFDQMVALDIRYLQNWSLGTDLMIMARTPYIVLFDKAY